MNMDTFFFGRIDLNNRSCNINCYLRNRLYLVFIPLHIVV